MVLVDKVLVDKVLVDKVLVDKVLVRKVSNGVGRNALSLRTHDGGRLL